jgi:HAD superfamily hydrolase (TIGR01509 family)
MKNTIKLIIFDLDGVLVDACEWHKIAFDNALQKVKSFSISNEDHKNYFNGLPTKTKINILQNKFEINFTDIEKQEIFDLKQKETIEIINKNCNSDLGKIELLYELKKNFYKVACYTNSIRQTADLMLERSNIVQYFDNILTNTDVNATKPHPEGYIKTMQKLSFHPSETLIIEDSDKGYQAAIASGAFVCRVKDQDEVNLELFRKIGLII